MVPNRATDHKYHITKLDMSQNSLLNSIYKLFPWLLLLSDHGYSIYSSLLYKHVTFFCKLITLEIEKYTIVLRQHTN